MKTMKKSRIIVSCALLMCAILLVANYRTSIIIKDAETGHIYARIKSIGRYHFPIPFGIANTLDDRTVSYAFELKDSKIFKTFNSSSFYMTPAEIEDLSLAPGETLSGYPPGWTYDENSLIPISITTTHDPEQAYDEISLVVGEACFLGYWIPDNKILDFERGTYADRDLVELCGTGTKIQISFK